MLVWRKEADDTDDRDDGLVKANAGLLKVDASKGANTKNLAAGEFMTKY